MKNSKNKRTSVLAVILLGLLILAYKTMFVTTEDLSSDENIIASQRVEGVLSQIDKINFDTSIMDNENFKSLKNIAMPLPALPVGRVNPFSEIFGSN